MANGEEKGSDFYAVLGLKKECADSELRNAYKKLALKWHPDRCSASEAKKKFQDIQHAYSVLSDANKRFLYDVGVYDSDDDDENVQGMGDFLNEMAMMMSETKPKEGGIEPSTSGARVQGMGDFLNEMATMMRQTKPNDNVETTFEEFQDLFDEMFHGDIGSFGSGPPPATSCSTSSYVSYCESSGSSNKRNSSEMNYEKATLDDSSGFDTHFQSFCFGVESLQDVRKGRAAREGMRGEATSRRRQGGKQKGTSARDVSSNDYHGISAR